MKVLSFIPARENSKRIPKKNIRMFCSKPLLSYVIKQSLDSPHINRTIVSTESPKIARVAKQYGAEVPFLRPKRLASDLSNVDDSIRYTLARLKKEEAYEPTHFVILQTTSPLREQSDIDQCFEVMKRTGATTVLTVSPTHPKLYHLSKRNDLILVNGSEKKQSTTQLWEKGYLLNGCVVYLVDVKAFLKEGRVITKKSKAVIMPKWRSIDLDDPEEWVIAEILYKNRKRIEQKINKIDHEKRA
ncbi:MAG: acylneuraminate cytidylyltransferase family protein [Parcubacteria group bacterium CG_4_9_14_0_2_um_filter_41_8]|nr:MAG: acylneuraminate cytidylyltransferase family protein [Parcubacteria group bacterium CG_4_9_14_0_2_um_filter_41_8]